MLILYRKEDCPSCKAIQETLESMSLAHKVVIVNDENRNQTEIPGNISLPVLRDGDETISGNRKILDHLEELEDFKKEWYKFQSDVCYCDSEGNVEC